MPSPELRLSAQERAHLHAIAVGALEAGVRGARHALELHTVSLRLRAPGASFVTLERRRALRGCLGSLEVRRPLAEDVAANARAAALHDPRFEPVAPAELPEIAVHVSVLGPLEPFPVASEEELLSALRPGVDGLVLEESHRRATFLPAVWSSLPSPEDFLAQLRHKAGLPPGHWSASLRFFRYEVEEIP